MKATSLERAARRSADRALISVGGDAARLRDDAGLTRAAVGRAAGVDPSYLQRIERGAASASVETYARVATALGADLSVRLYPNTGPAIRDRHQARIVEALLEQLHSRWQPHLEIAVRRPSRGWIDVGLYDAGAQILVATEVQSDLRRLEQLIRWSSEKAASLPSWDGWGRLGPAIRVSQLLIVRDTRATRTVARDFRRTLALAYPAHPDDALAALMGTDPWPGSALLWSVPSGEPAGGSRIVARR